MTIGPVEDVGARRPDDRRPGAGGAAPSSPEQELDELRDFFDNAAMSLHCVAADGTILRANRAELDFLGYEAHEYIGHHISEFHADQAVIDDILTRLKRNEILHDYEARLRCKDGSVRHVLIDSNVLWRDGEFVHTRCLTRDNTRRKLAEQQLQSSEERWRSLANSLPALIFSSAPGLTDAWFSQSYLDYTGMSQDDLRKGGWRSVAHPDDVERIEADFRRALGSGVSVSGEWRIRRADGEYRWHIGNIAPVHDRSGAIASWVGASTDIHDRKGIEDTLRENEERLRLASEASRLGTWEWDLGETVVWSEGLETIFGFAPGTYPGTFEAYMEHVHPDDRERLAASISAAAAGEGEIDLEHRVVWPDGSLHWIAGRGNLVRDPSGTPTRMLGVGIDITDRKRAEKMLEATRSQLESAVAAGAIGIWSWDIASNWLTADPFTVRMFGLDPDELPSGVPIERFLPLVDAEDRERVQSDIASAVQDSKMFETQFRVRSLDGASRWVVVRGTVERDTNGVATRFAGAVVDITGQKQTEEALRDSEERYRSLAELMPAMVTLSDATGRIVYCNRRLLDYSGMSEEQMLSGDYLGIFHPDDFGGPIQSSMSALQRGEAVEGEYRARRYDGMYRWHLGRVAPVRDASGQITMWIGTHIDIDDRKRAEEAVRISEEQFRARTEALPLLAWETDTEGNLTYVNNEIVAFAGVPADEILGLGFRRFIHPAELAESTAGRSELMASGAAGTSERRLLRADGQYRRHVIRLAPIRADDGSVHRWIGTAIDVEDARLALEEAEAAGHALAESEGRYRSLVEATTSLVWTTDAAGEFTEAQRAWAGYTGQSWDEHRGNGWANAIHPDDRAQVQELWNAALAAASVYESSGRIWHEASGSYRHFEARGAPVIDLDGSVREWIGTITDVHARREAEAELARQREQLQVMTDALPVLISYVDASYRYQFNNRAYEEWFGHSVEEVRGRTLEDVLGVAAFAAVKPHVLRAFAGEHVTYETMIPYKDGGARWVHATYVPDLDDDGAVRGFFALVMDITDRKRIEQDQAILAELGTALNASLDIDDTTRAVLSSTVPAFADAAGVFIPDESERLKRVAITTSDPHTQTLATFPVPTTPAVGPAHVIATGEAEFFAVVPDEHLAALATDDEHLAALRNAGIVSSAVVPVRARGNIIGALAFTTLESGRVFDARDFALAREIARRAGLAIENARLFEEVRTALKDTEEARTLLARVTATSPTGIAFWDREFRYAMINETLAGMNGLPVEAHIGRTVEEIMPELWPEVEPVFHRVLAGEDVLDIEVTGAWAISRELFHVMRSYYPVRLANGDIVGIAATVVDITERKRAEDEQRLLVGVGDAMNESLDEHATILAVLKTLVPAMADSAIISRPSADGLIDHARVEPGDPSELIVATSATPPDPAHGIAATLRTGSTQWYMQTPDAALAENTLDDATLQALHEATIRSTIIVPIRARQEVIAALTLMTTESASNRRYDERDMRLAQEIARRAGLALENARLYREAQDTLEALRRALEAKDEFLGMVSHELKTPITTIYGNAEVLRLRARQLDEESRAAALADIGREAERLHRIIDNLLVLARLEQGKEIGEEPVLLTRTIQRIAEDHRARFPHRDLRIEAPADDVVILGTDVYVEQVVRNLLSNAEKYSPPDAPIEIAVGAVGRDARVSFRDRGPGFSEEEAEHLFTPFYRSPGTSAHTSGVGIGLAVCKRLVETLGGELWASPRDGGGADIGFTLPLADDSE